MNILGISTCSHDVAACLVQDGVLVADAREEQFPREKNATDLPVQSITDCLQQAGLNAGDLECIAFDAKPLMQLGRILTTSLAFAPSGFSCFLKEMGPWIKQQFRLKRQIVRQADFQGEIIFFEHHEALAASAFFSSSFQEAAFLTIDGVSEWATASCGFGTETGITLAAEMQFPHSLGLLYSAFTRYSGFPVDADDDNMTDLVASGEPKYKNLILSRLMDLKEDGSFKLDLSYFDYCAGSIVPNARFAELFGRPVPSAGEQLTATDKDLACSIQAVVEEIILMMVEHVHVQTGMDNLCLSGWISRNSAVHEHILLKSSFDDIRVQPASGKAAAQGAALCAWHQYLGNKKRVVSE